MAAASAAAYGAAIGVAIALAVVTFALRGRGHPEDPCLLYTSDAADDTPV